ncbi:unnamed protein product, partial [Mesorhabditis spiculigera]
MLLRRLVSPQVLNSFSVRWNCPWHRSNFRPCYFPFKIKDKVNTETVEARTKTRGGRLMLMRRVLREQPFLGYITAPKPSDKVEFPL